MTKTFLINTSIAAIAAFMFTASPAGAGHWENGRYVDDTPSKPSKPQQQSQSGSDYGGTDGSNRRPQRRPPVYRPDVGADYYPDKYERYPTRYPPVYYPPRRPPPVYSPDRPSPVYYPDRPRYPSQDSYGNRGGGPYLPPNRRPQTDSWGGSSQKSDWDKGGGYGGKQ